MRILIAPDKFKGCLSAQQVADSVVKGIKLFGKHHPAINIDTLEQPIGDGGEGTVSLICENKEACHLRKVQVIDALGDSIPAQYYLCKAEDGSTQAFLEMASASGLALIPAKKRSPEHSTSYGTGQIILDAIQAGATEIYVALGGSATIDCGAGMLQALGFEFLQNSRAIDLQALVQSGRTLAEIFLEMESVRVPSPSAALPPGLSFHIVADVDSPLHGPEGAIQCFAGQKGLPAHRFSIYRSALERFSALCEEGLDPGQSGRAGKVRDEDAGKAAGASKAGDEDGGKSPGASKAGDDDGGKSPGARKVRDEDGEQEEHQAREPRHSLSRQPGAGAAGGMGFALMLLGAELHPGFQFFCEQVGMNALLRSADLVITGEGKLDATSLSGKGPGGLARLCNELNIPCIAVAGKVEDRSGLEQSGLFTDIREIGTGLSPEESVKRAPELISVQVLEVLESFLHVT